MKRIFDLLVVMLFAPIWLPVCLLMACLCKRLMGSPVLFKQDRPGLYGKPFTLYKFRTMVDRRGHDNELLCDEERVTRFGEFLRNTSLDELPELWNVIRGDMSLVGPRPLLMEYIDRYTPEEARRHDVRPGVTGWAQINGRVAITFAERFKLDVWYVDNHLLWLDIKILLITLWKSFTREGVHKKGQPQEVFRGTKLHIGSE